MNKEELLKQYKEYQNQNLHLDLSRGKPDKEQLDLSLPMMDVLSSKENYLSEEGIDVRNYGELTGITECKRLMSNILEVPEKNIIIFGNSSLQMMYDQISRSFTHGVCGNTPWYKLNKIKWLCPVPGYDRHFSITEHFGIEMINIPMNNDGPDMDLVESLIKDESVKGIWCVPKYSNPSGITYSDEIVRRFARLKPAAKDFRIYWDNAYAMHGFNEDKKLLNIYEEAKKNNNEDIVYIFTSTSKITFPGGGIAALGASENNIKDIKSQLKYQIISFDKINQLRHVRYFKDYQGMKEHMKKHLVLLKEKFDLVDSILKEEVSNLATWNKPEGGYFICLYVKNKAKEVIDRCLKCGLKLTDAGATHPYHKDESNSYIRIAPTYASLDELRLAVSILCLSIKIELYEDK